ncbi:uncharacterized protein LOC125324980 isoform X7 [Corvus hawaiiensis]|uniref:uncharacterized protein LOC125324980 isoform X7 n=1 Tax=Corvus hawaiiensis TaxID=134902 RepID=UPI0020196DC9|nr:uncharacterized protein LOC125324980 isoform X7 [Corvus hawaiiensis]
MVPGGGGDGTADLRGGGRGGGGTTGDWLRDSGTADLGLCFTPAPGGLDYVMTWSVANLALQLGRSCAAGPFPRRLLINLLKASLCDFDITFPIMTRINPEA